MEENKSEKTKNKWLIIFIIIVLAISIIGGVALGIKDANSSNEKEEKKSIVNLDETIYFENIAYNVSSNWVTTKSTEEENTNFYLHYISKEPYIWVGVMVIDVPEDITEMNQLAAQSIASGIVKSEEDIVSINIVEINNKKFGAISCFTYSNENKNETLAYTTIIDNKAYIFSVTQKDKLDKKYKNILKKVLNTIAVRKIEFEKESIKIVKNDFENISISVEPSSLKKEISYSSSDESIVIIDENTIKGVNNGKATVIATTPDGLTDSIEVTVYTPIEKIELDVSEIELGTGEPKNITATITPSDASYEEIKWKSSNSSIVTVDDNGNIFAQSAGEAKISAYTSDISASCNVVVKEKPIEFSGNGDTIISDVNIPAGEYKATITVNSTRHYAIKFYYGQGDYDYELLVNNSGETYSGVTYLKGGRTEAIINGMFEIDAEGPWTIQIEKINGDTAFPITGNGDQVTGVFEGSGGREVFNIKVDSTRHYAIKIYKYNGDKYDYDLLVNDSGKTYDGQVIASTKKGEKYFFVIESEGNWSIEK